VTPAVDWVASLSPWPVEGFGLERMRELLRELGDPQLAYPAVHVVGTNGKSTATRTIEALLLAEGLSVGATVSPHVRHWSERITVDGEEADFGAAIARVRPAAERLAATQFETITAAAFAEFAGRRVDAAVVEAGLGGRLDATNVLDTRVVLLTNVGLEHTDVLGETPEEIAREKLAVAHADSIVVMSDNRYARLVPGRRVVPGGAHEAAEAFLGRPVGPAPEIRLPGRLERRPGEVRDGAHNPDGVRWLVERLADDRYVVVASILADKDADEMLELLARVGDVFVAPGSSNTRALPAAALASVARRHFREVHVVADPVDAVGRGHALGEPVLVTGSLYLLADLEAASP
jgi:dihydrofolate synthase/folylpolyglutamate synthase